MDIQEFRSQYPQYNDISDADLASSLHAKFYSDVPYHDFETAFIGSTKPSDYVKSLASGALSGAGMIAQGGGELLARGINAVAPQAELRSVNPFQGAIDWLEASKSPAAHAAEAGTQISGSLTDPSTWSFGTNPTMAGLALQGFNAIGQFAPNLAIALGTAGASVPAQLTIGAVTGGLQALGGGAEQERQAIQGMSHEELLAASNLYRTFIDLGVDRQTAKDATAESAALGGGIGNAIPSAAEGAFENFIVGALTRGRLKIPSLGGGLAGRVATGVAGGSAIGGTEEAAEQAAQNLGSNVAIGGNRPLTADTLQQFVMGAIAEGAAGAGGGALSHITTPVQQPVSVPTPQMAVPAPLAATTLQAQPEVRQAVQTLDSAPDVDTAIQAATAIAEAPVAPVIAHAEAFAQAETEAGQQKARETEAAYQQREDRIAQLNRMIQMELERDASRTEAGAQEELARREEVQQADLQDQARGTISQAMPEAPQTAMSLALARAAGTQPPGYVSQDELLRRMEALAAQGRIQEPGVTNASTVRSDAGQVPAAGQVEAGGGIGGGENLQQPPATGINPNGPELRAASGTGEQPNAVAPVAQPAPAAAQPVAAVPVVPTQPRSTSPFERRNEIQPAKDTLFQAIAKLGGLNKQEVVSTWGTDLADLKRLPQIFGKPLLRTNGGHSIDGMAELLVQHGYLDQRDLREFEAKFDQELRGKPVLTMQGHEQQAQLTAQAIEEDRKAESLGLTPAELVHDGYEALNEPEKEQVQAIIDALVQHARGTDYEHLVDAILERAALQAGDRPYGEYAQAVITQIREVIANAEHPNNEPAQTVGGTSRQGLEEAHRSTGTEGRPAASAQAAPAELALTSQTPEELRAQESPAALVQREAAERKAIADRERDHFTLTPQAPAERVAAPSQQEGLFTPTGQAAEAAKQPVARTRETVEAELNALSEKAAERRKNAKDESIKAMRPTDSDWMTPEEFARFQSLQAELAPLTREHNAGAAERVKQKRAARVAAMENASERPYKDTPRPELQRLYHETDDDATLKAVEDELNLRAEEKAKTREERLAKAREERAKPKERAKPLQGPKPVEIPGALSPEELERTMREQGIIKQSHSGYTGPLWYSALERSVASLKQETAPASQWKMLLSNMSGIKKDELQWSGVLDWLDMQQDKVTRQQIIDYLAQNGVKVEETMLGGNGSATSELDDIVVKLDALGFDIGTEPSINGGNEVVLLRRRRDDARYDVTVDGRMMADGQADQSISDLPDDVQTLVRRVHELAWREENPQGTDTRYSSYTLPGGQNYRELLLTLPRSTLPDGWRIEETKEGKFAVYNPLGSHLGNWPTREAAERSQGRQVGGKGFFSSHFDQPNILAHVRFNERTDADGKKVLFIEEIQSDWAQSGKRRGFLNLQDREKADAVNEAFAVYTQSLRKKYHRNEISEVLKLATDSEADEFARLQSETQKYPSPSVAIPSAPFVGKTESWVALALKRMIRYAAENGFDRVAWTTGEQQADRYDLSKHVDRIWYRKDGDYKLRIRKVGSQHFEDFGSYSTEKLPEVVGKGVADQIISDSGEKADLPGLRGWKQLAGQSLRIGGEGMRAFYDKIVPNVANDVLKKLGGERVGEVQIENPLKGVPPAQRDHVEQPGFDITPALRGKAMQGMALFQNKSEYNAQTDHIYDNAQTRPGTTGEQRNLGIAAVKALFGTDRRAGSTILGSAIWRDFQERKGTELVGQQVREAKDLATLAQILRDPRFETFRFFFTKGDTIVGHSGVTARLPGQVVIWQRAPGENADDAIARYAEHIQSLKDGFGADGYWMLHNHPSGSSEPSENDIGATKNVASTVLGFKGHVVIDHNEFSVIDANGKPSTHKIESGAAHPAEVPHDLLGKTINGPNGLVDIARKLQHKSGYDVMISLNAQNKVQAIAEVPTQLLLQQGRNIIRARKFAKGTGADRVFVVSQNPSRLERLVASGAVTDATDFAGHKPLRTLGIGPKYGEEGKTAYRARILTAEQKRSAYDQTQTPAFKRWFGDSKVVDAEGKPLVVYHGTNASFDVPQPHRPTAVFRLNGKEIKEANSWDMGDDRTGMPEGYHYGALGDAAALGAKKALEYRTEEAERGGHLGKPDTERTLRDLRRLQNGELKRTTESRPSGAGMWFTPEPSYGFISRRNVAVGDDLGANVMPVYLSIKNPAYVNASEIEGAGYDFNVAEYKKEGYDGAIFANDPKDLRKGGWGGPTQIVAFDPEQIKSAIGNRGTFSPESPNILEQHGSEYRIAGSKTTGDYKDSFARQATDFMTNYFTGFDKIGWWQKTVGTPFNLALENKEFAPFYHEGQAYINDISRYGNESADLAQDLLPRVEHFRDVLPAWLGGKSAAERSDVLAASKALYAGTLWGGGSPLEGRVWTDEELRSGRARDKNGVSIPAFQPMSTKQIALYRQALAATSKSMDELAKSLIQRIARPLEVGFHRSMSLEDAAATVQSQIDGLIEDANMAAHPDEARIKTLNEAKTSVADIADKAKTLNEAGYFPAMRFGKYALHVVKDGRQLYFGMYESKAQALVAEHKLKQEFPGAEIQKGTIPREKYKLFQGLSLDALEAFSDYIVDADGNQVAKDALVQGLLKAATAERSVMKRHIHRKGIPGYSEDVPRVLASFVVSAARSIASNYHAAEMLKLAQGIKSGDVSDYAAKLARYMLDPQEEAQGLRGFLFAQYLGGSIASGLVNITQPFMVTAPWASQYTSYADAVAKLGKASTENADKLTGAIGEAYKRAKREGIVTPQEIHQLRAETGGGIGARSLALRKLSFAWGSIFSLAEQFNRKATFLAAYRIADEMTNKERIEKGIEDPYTFAKRAVAETQFTYNKGNRPVFSRGMLGATVMTFKQFSISYLEMARRLYKADKTAFALLALTLLAAGGIEGLPFAEDLEDLVDTMGQWLGYATNSKKKVRQWAMNILGPDLAQVALRGVSGLSWMPVDISARMGMANLIPGTAALKLSEKNKTRDIVEMAGPAGQFLPVEGTMMGNALERLGKGDIGGAAQAAAPQAIQAALKGGQMLETGQAKDLKGRKITEVTPGEAVLKMAGLQPSSVARESQRIGIIQQDIELQNKVKAEISEKWARGVVDKQPEEVRAAREQMRQWNEDNPELRIHVDSKNVLPRIKEMRMTREQRFVKHAPPEIRTGVRAALR